MTSLSNRRNATELTRPLMCNTHDCARRSGRHRPAPVDITNLQHLPDSARGFANHRLARLAAKSFLEGGRVLHYAVHAPASWRMRIGDRQHPRLLVGNVLAPDLAVSNEEPLLWRVAVDGLHRRIADDVHQCHVSQLEAAIVGGILAQR